MSAGARFHVLPSDMSEDEEVKALIEWVGAVMWATFGIRYIYNRGHLFCATIAKKLCLNFLAPKNRATQCMRGHGVLIPQF
jgi:hypothetical protein